VLETAQPDLLLVDLMLPDYHSIDIIQHVANTQPQVKILALAPADPPHDKVILAVQAGALGYVCRDAAPAEYPAAIQQVLRGEPWLPVDATYVVLQEADTEFRISTQERRDRLAQLILGLIPLAGVLATVTAFLWRRYWIEIRIRPEDIGIDPTTRMVEVLSFLLILVGVFGPLFYVGAWVQALASWVAEKPGLAGAVAKARSLRIGRLLLNRTVAWVLLALLVLTITISLALTLSFTVILIIGPAMATLILAGVLGLDQDLPAALQLPKLSAWRVLTIVGIILVVFLVALSVEMLSGPDLRTDGLHGLLVPAVFGFSAEPVLAINPEQGDESQGMLYLGGNTAMYVLYDPCEHTVRFVPVGPWELKLVDQVTCP
jgi:CheY-like chemotaxis protein